MTFTIKQAVGTAEHRASKKVRLYNPETKGFLHMSGDGEVKDETFAYFGTREQVKMLRVRHVAQRGYFPYVAVSPGFSTSKINYSPAGNGPAATHGTGQVPDPVSPPPCPDPASTRGLTKEQENDLALAIHDMNEGNRRSSEAKARFHEDCQ